MANSKNFRMRQIYISDRAWGDLARIARIRKARIGEGAVGAGSEHISCSEIVRQLIDEFLAAKPK
jgi:hypothetical protein